MSYSSAERKIAAFLLAISAESRSRGDSSAEFRLQMKSQEIIDDLEIARATVFRTFAKFQQEGLIVRNGPQVRILDADGLRLRARSCPVARQQTS